MLVLGLGLGLFLVIGLSQDNVGKSDSVTPVLDQPHRHRSPKASHH